METVIKNAGALMGELIDTWDFVLGAAEFPHTVGFQYKMREVRGSIILGHDRADHQKFNVVLSPETIGGREYLFHMKVMKTKETYCYFFNHIEDRISGRFGIWSTRGLILDPEVDILITAGIFVGRRHWLSWAG